MANPAGKSAGGGRGGKSKMGGESECIKSTYALSTTRAHVLTLRQALQTDLGHDKDVTAPFQAFKSFSRNGLSAAVEFGCGKMLLSQAQKSFVKAQFQTHKEALRACGLTVEDKQDDLRDPAARFLFVEEVLQEASVRQPAVLAFCHFRFTLEVRRSCGGGGTRPWSAGRPACQASRQRVTAPDTASPLHRSNSEQGEMQEKMEGEPVLLVCDMFVAPAAQRKGLGRHLLALLELIARREKMTGLMVAAYSQLATSITPFMLTRLKGYALDSRWAPETDEYLVFSKSWAAPAVSAENAAPNVAAAAPPPPAKFEPVAAAAAVAMQQQLEAISMKSAAPQAAEDVEDAADENDADDEEEEEEEDEDEMAERLMDELCAMFAEKHGRDPTEEEIAQWRETLASAS